jgi:hypothetical protein
MPINIPDTFTVIGDAFMQDIAGGSGALQYDLQEFTTSGIWVMPPNCLFVEIFIANGGNGGDSGGRQATGVVSRGGANGIPSSLWYAYYFASTLTPYVSVIVGAGGTGGAAVTADSTDRNAGTMGGSSQFGNYLSLPMVGNVPISSTSTSISGLEYCIQPIYNIGTSSTFQGNPFPQGYSYEAASAGSSVGPSNGNTTTTPLDMSFRTVRVARSGYGGQITAANASSAGKDGGGGAVFGSTTIVANAIGGANGGGDGANGDNNQSDYWIAGHIGYALRFGGGTGLSKIGGGAGGGGSSTTTAGGKGGNGGLYAQGGGGGGASRNGFNSGAGGNGSQGFVKVLSVYLP